MAYVTRTHGERPHAKFQPPTMTGLAVHKGQTEGQNKGNANIYVDYFPYFPKINTNQTKILNPIKFVKSYL